MKYRMAIETELRKANVPNTFYSGLESVGSTSFSGSGGGNGAGNNGGGNNNKRAPPAKENRLDR
jgi:hypothetical protein